MRSKMPVMGLRWGMYSLACSTKWEDCTHHAVAQPFLHPLRTSNRSKLQILFLKVFNTKRVALAWVQIAKKRRARVISVYATTGASNDFKIHSENDGTPW